MKKTTLKLLIMVGTVVLLLALLACSAPQPTTTSTSTTQPTSTTSKPTTPGSTTTTAAPTTKPAPQPSAAVYNWKMQTHLGASEANYKNIVRTNDAIGVASGGRIAITTYAGNALVPPTQQFDAVGKGAIDMSWTTGSYMSGTYPELVLEAGLPLSWKNFDEAAIILWQKGLEDFYRETYAKGNNYLLPMTPGGGNMLFSAKPINTAADFKGMKIRTYGMLADVFTALGASTVYVPGGEIYMGLQLKTFDAATWASESSMYDYKWQEVAKYILMPKVVSCHLNSPSINLDTWKKVPVDLQKIMTWGYLDLAVFNFTQIVGDDNGVYTKYLAPAGVKYSILAPAEEAKMVQAAEVAWAKYAAQNPRTKQAIGIITDYLRAKGYTTFDVSKI